MDTSNAESETSATRVRRAFTRGDRGTRAPLGTELQQAEGEEAGDGEPEVGLGRAEHEAHPEYGELCREAEVREDRDGEVVVRRTSADTPSRDATHTAVERPEHGTVYAREQPRRLP